MLYFREVFTYHTFLLSRKAPSVDRELFIMFEAIGMTTHYAMPWVITWFSHSVRNVDAVIHLFEFFLDEHPVLPVYTSVALITHPMVR